MSLVFGTFMTFLAFLLFDNITKSSLWCKSRLLWHFWYFLSFCCLYKSKKVSCRFTDVSFTLMFPSIHHTDIVQRQLGTVGKMSRYRIKVPHNSLIVLSSLL